MKPDTDKTLSHIDQHNNPSMVDVSDKPITSRTATAQTKVLLPAAVKAALHQAHASEGFEINSKKGPVFQTAIIAGVMAAKQTHELIPFCHPLALDNCKIVINVDNNQDLIINCECKTSGKTGVEMEALTGASVAALTIYDMCKALSHNILITETRLLAKSGGRADFSSDQTPGSEQASGQITIEFYGQLQSTFSQQPLQYKIPNNTTSIEAVYLDLCATHNCTAATATIKPILNDNFAQWNDLLNDRDVLGFLPPAAGG